MAPNRSRKRPLPSGEDGTGRRSGNMDGQNNSLEKIKNKETLVNISRGSVGKLLKRVNSRGSKGLNVEDCSYLQPCNSSGKLENGSRVSVTQCNDTVVESSILNAASCSGDAEHTIYPERTVEGRSSKLADHDKEDEPDDTEWEDGSIPTSYSENDIQDNSIQGMTVEFDVIPTPSKRKVIRRATAEEKEVAELVHKVHLLCMIGRGRLIDRACDDPLIQASLLSILPMHLLKIAEVPQVTAKVLTPLVSWFHNNFRIRMTSNSGTSFHSALASAIETHEGSPEEVAALSVALFRALKLTTRFVSILDVVRLKPDADKSESPGQGPTKAGGGIFNSSTLMVAGSSHSHVSPAKSPATGDKEKVCETPSKGGSKSKARKSLKDSFHEKKCSADKSCDGMFDQSASVVQDHASDACLSRKAEGLKRKGDLEYELQLEMALSATAVESLQHNMTSDTAGSCSTSNLSSPFKRKKKVITEESLSSHGISTAIGSKKIGAPLYWAEVYCSGENLTGKWVHVDAVNALIDGEQKVEAAAAACKRSLRYVVAFAGQGAKDVTRRYCAKWYNIASQRINSIWWDEVLGPLKDLESAEYTMKDNAELSLRNSGAASRSTLEDMELETRALTEPLPTNQQAYKNHPLYAIERWLNKYQILYPKGPVLGFCSGHPVYPRTCVQTLHTKERWMREGLQVKADELPAKVLNRSQKNSKAEDGEEDECIADHGGTVDLYGKWQTGPLCLPHAVDGIVPRNERGQVDVWSEKCLPPGTVHLRLPRLVPIVKRLEIDFAPAMVGFDFQNGRSVPVYEGLVVCAEFKDIVLEAYAEEEVRREAEDRRRNEAQALSRWYQLISSIVTRQRLQNCYKDGASSEAQSSINTSKSSDRLASITEDVGETARHQQVITPDNKPSTNTPAFVLTEDHQHEFFLADDQALDEEGSTRTKRCRCGFSIQIEEL